MSIYDTSRVQKESIGTIYKTRSTNITREILELKSEAMRLFLGVAKWRKAQHSKPM